MEKVSKLANLSKDKDVLDGPDVIFGIDIGMCFTKVAYAVRESGQYRVYNHQSWTTLGGGENATDYVPTVLRYETVGGHSLQDDRPDQVGFIKDYNGRDVKVYEWFKEHFPGNLISAPGVSRVAQGNAVMYPPTTDTVILYRHFLKHLYYAIKTVGSQLLKSGPSWEESCIEFIFSVPATWNRLTETLDNITERFDEVVKDAGFGYQNPRHRVMIGLTEPEAAAAFCLSSQDDSHYIQNGNKVLVVDAGGGTTDICLLDKRPSNDGEIIIDPLSAPVGEKLGSSDIDRSFERLVREKLRKLAHDNNLTEVWDPAKMSREMRNSPIFQNNKKSLDMTKVRSGEYFTVPLPDTDLKMAGVPAMLEGEDLVNNQLKFDWIDLATIFDTAVLEDREVMINGRPETRPGLIKLIYRARDQLMHRGAGHGSQGSAAEDVNLIILSGGLGSSEYIKYKVEEYLANRPGSESGAAIPKVQTLSHPQMCVCRGLIENRVLRIWRAARCNGSYGIIQKVPYKRLNPRHQLAKFSNHLHRTEGKRYVEQIHWLVKKDQPKPDEPLTLRHTFEPGSPRLLVEFVVSHESRPSRFPNRDDFVAKVSCNLSEPSRSSETEETYCFVELSFHVARVEVKCWSANRQLIGQYVGDWEARQA